MSVQETKSLPELVAMLKRDDVNSGDMVSAVDGLSKELVDFIVAQVSGLPHELRRIVLDVTTNRLDATGLFADDPWCNTVGVYDLLMAGWSRVHTADDAIWVHDKATCPVTFAEAVDLYQEGVRDLRDV